MFERDYEYIGVFVGYLQKILEIISNFINSIFGSGSSSDSKTDDAPADDAEG